MIKQLISILLDSRKDISAAKIYLDVLGHDHLKNLSPSTQEFFHNNVNLIRNTSVGSSNQFEYFYPAELEDESILYIDDEAKFKEMLDYFETTKPNIIGEVL